MISLGYVFAPTQPQALAAAWAEWPDKVDPSRVQAGFSVRVTARDDFALGALWKGPRPRLPKKGGT